MSHERPGDVAVSTLPTASGPDRVSGMMLASILRPRSIAVIGASPRTFIGRVALDNCRRLGFAGPVRPVNPKYDEVAGIRAAPSVAELDIVPDVALVLVSTDRAVDLIEDAVAHGVRNFVVPGGGYTDSGDAAVALMTGLRRLADHAGITVVGPNCMGVADLVTGAAPYIGTVTSHVRRGSVALVAQSGAIVEAVVNAGGRVPLSTAVSCGAEATTDLSAYLECFAEDPETSAVLAFVEGFGDAAPFLAAAHRLAEAGKPLAVCKVGRSGVAKAGIQAHSGQLAGSARVAEAALRQVGVIVCDDLDQLLAAGEVLGARRQRFGTRMHVVANSGGEANLLADVAEEVGLDLPAISPSGRASLRQRWPRFHVSNPLDPWGVDDYPAVYPAAVQAAADEPGDLLVLSVDQQTTCGDYEKQLGRDLAGYLAAATAAAGKTPVFLSPTSQDPDPALAALCRSHAIPLLRGVRPALTVLARIAGRRLPDGAAPPPRAPITLPTRNGRPYDEHDALDALARYGLPTVRRHRASSVEAAVAAADELGYPVVVKGLSPDVSHKTEAGLVRTGIADASALRRAAAELLATGLAPELLVAQHVRADLELLVGFRRDEQFGPTVLVGLGGVWAETLDQVALRVGRVGRPEALRMLEDCLAGRMLQSARGGALPVGDVADAICAVAALGCDHAEIIEIDVNPLMAARDGVVAVDALLVHAGDRPEDDKEDEHGP